MLTEKVFNSNKLLLSQWIKRGCKKSADRIKPDIARGSVGLISLISSKSAFAKYADELEVRKARLNMVKAPFRLILFRN